MKIKIEYFCFGEDCPLAENCRRFTDADGYGQYFEIEPYLISQGKLTCSMFWGEAQDYIMEDLYRHCGVDPEEDKCN